MASRPILEALGLADLTSLSLSSVSHSPPRPSSPPPPSSPPCSVLPPSPLPRSEPPPSRSVPPLPSPLPHPWRKRPPPRPKVGLWRRRGQTSPAWIVCPASFWPSAGEGESPVVLPPPPLLPTSHPHPPLLVQSTYWMSWEGGESPPVPS